AAHHPRLPARLPGRRALLGGLLRPRGDVGGGRRSRPGAPRGARIPAVPREPAHGRGPLLRAALRRLLRPGPARAGGAGAHRDGPPGRHRARPPLRPVQALGRRRPPHPRPGPPRLRPPARARARRLRSRPADEPRTLVSGPGGRALFERLPRLADLVPFLPLADGLPTQTEQLDDGLWVKRDDRTSSHYGGNKV